MPDNLAFIRCFKDWLEAYNGGRSNSSNKAQCLAPYVCPGVKQCPRTILLPCFALGAMGAFEGMKVTVRAKVDPSVLFEVKV